LDREFFMKRSRWAFHFALLLVGIFVSAISVQAQFRASLRGTVTDPQGSVIADAKVTLVDKDTSKTLVATTNGDGIYIFNALPPAPYRLTIEHDGFKQKVLEDVKIIPEQLNALDVQMELGQVQQTVTVASTVEALDTETATVSGTISSNQIQHMPSLNRDVFQLAQLAPGVFGDASQARGGGSYDLPGTQGPGGSSVSSAGIFQTENGPQINSGGGQYETNGITIDGISTVSAVWGGTSIITPTEDSVGDMKVVSNSYDAENGRFSGAQIQVTTKGGTNEFHGSAFFKASRPGLNAYQRWNGVGSNQPGTPKQRGLNRDESRFNNYGGSLGGPILKNRIFAFFAWETSPFVASATTQNWYETSQFDSSAASAGSIAARYLSFPGNPVAANAIIPRTCGSIGLQEGVNCRTVSGGLDLGSPLKNGLGLQDPTYGGNAGQPGVGGGLDGVPDLALFNLVNPTNTSQMQFNGRVDADVTQKDRIAFALYWVPISTTSYQGTNRPLNLWHHSQVNNAFSLIWNHTFSPTLLNQARANAAGWRWNEVATNPQAPFGLPQANIDTIGNTSTQTNSTAAQPQFFGANGPSNLNQWTYSYNDVLTKIAGRHSIKAGGEFTRLFYLNNPVYAARPGFTFHNLWDFANDAPYQETGQFDHATGIPFANRQDMRENLLGFFAQDDFKVRPNLTINLGLRWSYFGAIYAKQNNLDVMRFGSGSNPLTGLNIRVGGNLYTPQRTNFGPVVGFAWQPNPQNGKLVVRGGFGIAYNQNEIAITTNGTGNPPNAVQAQFTCPYPFTTNPSCTGTGILYETATNVHSIFGYAPNPNTITNFDPNNLPLTGVAFITGFPSDPKTISVYHYSVDVQYQLPFNTVMTLGYQGNQTRHSLVHNNWNSIAVANGLAFNPKVNFINFWDNSGSANYNAGLATITHNFSHQFQASAQYRWSKTLDELSGPYFQDPYPYSTAASYGPSDYNVQNAFKLFALWQPVFFRGGHSWIEKIAGGWSFSGIWNVHSGFPWNPFYATNDLYYQGSSYNQLRPASVVPGFGTSTSNSTFQQNTNPNYGGDGTRFFVAPSYVAGAAFPSASPAPLPGIHRNSLTGPRYNDVDLSVAKAFGLPRVPGLGENAKFEIRADMYNLFNTLNLNTQTIDASLGSIAPNGTVSPNSHFGVAGEALGSRTIQLQARFSF
jgi:Carboxypeptidase regulatory-like domain